MTCFLKKEHLDDLFTLIHEDEEYYVRMAIAWLLSVAYIRFPQETEEYFKNCALSSETIQKTISKICDSRRVEIEDKKRLKEWYKMQFSKKK